MTDEYLRGAVSLYKAFKRNFFLGGMNPVWRLRLAKIL